MQYTLPSTQSILVPAAPSTSSIEGETLAPGDKIKTLGWQAFGKDGNQVNCDIYPISISVLPTVEIAAHEAAAAIFTHFLAKPNGVFGTATGNTQIPVYKALNEMVRVLDGTGAPMNLTGQRFVGLDEYCDMEPSDPRSFRQFGLEHCYGPLGIDTSNQRSRSSWGNTHLPAPDPDQPLGQFCLAYEQLIRDLGGVDLQLLGIGKNGHIAFVEPRNGPGADALLWTRTRPVVLTDQTRLANFGTLEGSPTTAVSQGILTILEAREIVLVAFGNSKAQAVYDALIGPIGPHCPASYLRLHNKVRFILDQEAASLLPKP